MAGRLHRPTGAGLPSASARSNCQRGIIMRALSISPPAAVALARYVASLILTIVAVSSVAAEDVASYPSATIRIITLLATPPGPLVINEALYKELTFRPSELEPVIVMGSVPNVMDVRPGFPAKSAHDVLNYVLANP